MVSRLVSSGVKMEFAHFFFLLLSCLIWLMGCAAFSPNSHLASPVSVSSLRAGALALNVPSSCSGKTRLSLKFDAYVSIRNRIRGSAQDIAMLIPEI